MAEASGQARITRARPGAAVTGAQQSSREFHPSLRAKERYKHLAPLSSWPLWLGCGLAVAWLWLCCGLAVAWLWLGCGLALDEQRLGTWGHRPAPAK